MNARVLQVVVTSNRNTKTGQMGAASRSTYNKLSVQVPTDELHSCLGVGNRYNVYIYIYITMLQISINATYKWFMI